jgi:hypothetical protein
MEEAKPHCQSCGTTVCHDLVVQQTDADGELVCETCWRCCCRLDGMLYNEAEDRFYCDE